MSPGVGLWDLPQAIEPCSGTSRMNMNLAELVFLDLIRANELFRFSNNKHNQAGFASSHIFSAL